MLQIFEIEAEQIVPLDNVGIALADYPHHLSEHRALVQLIAAQHAFESGVVGDGNRHDPIAVARGGRKFEPGGDIGLDIELQAAQVAELHPMKCVIPVSIRYCSTGSASTRYGASGEPDVLPVTFLRCRLSASSASVEASVTRRRKRKSPFELGHLMRRAETAQRFGIVDDREQLDGAALAHEALAVALEDLDLGARRDFDRDDSALGGIAEQQAIAVELRRDFLPAAHAPLASLRWQLWCQHQSGKKSGAGLESPRHWPQIGDKRALTAPLGPSPGPCRIACRPRPY